MKNCDKISSYFKEFKTPFILSAISGLIYNVLMAYVPILQGTLIDDFVLSNEFSEIFKKAIFFLVLIIFIQINRYIKRYTVRDFSNKMVLAMREKTYENLILSDISNFVSKNRGDILTKNLTDISDSAEGVRKILTEVYDSLILLIAYFVSLLIIDYKLTLILSLFVLLSILTAKLMKKIIIKYVKAYKEETSINKELTLNLLNNEPYFRGFGVSDRYLAKYVEEQNVLYKKCVKASLFSSSFEPIYETIALLGVFFIIYFGGKNVINDAWLIGSFSAYLTTYVLISKKASKTGKLFNASAKLKVSWARIKPYLKDTNDFKTLENETKDCTLSVQNLTFGYSNFKINNISFLLNKGEILGICGPVHSGKSTLLEALSGLYEYEGSIKLNGLELKENKEVLISNFISYINSKSEIFSGTLKYNISFGNNFNQKTLKYVKLDNELEEDLELSHLTSNISGGQMKRVLIARGINNKASLTLFDDPFNAISNDLSIEIYENIRNELKDRIVIIVTKEKEILKNIDKILYLKENSYKIGKFEELYNDKSFRKLIGDNYEC